MRSGAFCLTWVAVAAMPGGLLSGQPAPAPPASVPPEVLRGAEAATRILGAEIIKGNLTYSIQRMYPRWRKRAAVREGGEDALAKKLMEVLEQKRTQGIDLLSFEAGQPRSSHRVHIWRGKNKETGEPVDVHREWLVFVPTRKVYRVPDPQAGRVRKLELKGYQVAIVKKTPPGETAAWYLEPANWHFIDGSSLTIPELRSFFPGLPEDQALLGLPPVGGGELKD